MAEAEPETIEGSAHTMHPLMLGRKRAAKGGEERPGLGRGLGVKAQAWP